MHWTGEHTSPDGQSADVLQPATQLDSLPQETQTWPCRSRRRCHTSSAGGRGGRPDRCGLTVRWRCRRFPGGAPSQEARTTMSDTVLGIVHLPTGGT
jgi:hypothetical protein